MQADQIRPSDKPSATPLKLGEVFPLLGQSGPQRTQLIVTSAVQQRQRLAVGFSRRSLLKKSNVVGCHINMLLSDRNLGIHFCPKEIWNMRPKGGSILSSNCQPCGFRHHLVGYLVGLHILNILVTPGLSKEIEEAGAHSYLSQVGIFLICEFLETFPICIERLSLFELG